MSKPKNIKPRCPKCGSGQVQFRKTDNIRWCRMCTHKGPAETFTARKKAA